MTYSITQGENPKSIIDQLRVFAMNKPVPDSTSKNVPGLTPLLAHHPVNNNLYYVKGSSEVHMLPSLD